MEYMESKMQEQIEAGISEADRCYARIAELEEQNAALAATVQALRSEIEYSATAIIERNPSGEIHAIACSMMETAKATPQQHLAELKAEAGRDGFIAGSEQTAQFITGEIGYVLPLLKSRANQYADSIRKGGAQ